MTTRVDTDALQNLGLMRQPQRQAKGDLAQDDFLSLMIAQLKNQDPFKPLESGEFLSEIAQFGTVTGIKELQDSFSKLANSLHSNQALQASALIGRTALLPSDRGVLDPGGRMEGMLNLASSTANVVIGIYDQGGQLVNQLELGPQPAGELRFSWDGRGRDGSQLAAGTYGIRATALVGNEYLSVETMVERLIESVTLANGSQGLRLNIAGMGPTDFSNVRQIK